MGLGLGERWLYFCHFVPLGKIRMTLSQPVRSLHVFTAGEQRHLGSQLEGQRWTGEEKQAERHTETEQTRRDLP